MAMPAHNGSTMACQPTMPACPLYFSAWPVCLSCFAHLTPLAILAPRLDPAVHSSTPKPVVPNHKTLFHVHTNSALYHFQTIRHYFKAHSPTDQKSKLELPCRGCSHDFGTPTQVSHLYNCHKPQWWATTFTGGQWQQKLLRAGVLLVVSTYLYICPTGWNGVETLR